MKSVTLSLSKGLAILAAVATLGACTMRSQQGERTASNDMVRVERGAEPPNLNPVISDNIGQYYFEEAIFDGLLKLDPSGNLLPDLAVAVPTRQNGGISSDLRTFTYRLRRGVMWQDGAPFTSRDVAFTYALLTNQKLASPYYSWYSNIAKLETPDDYTVRIRFKAPSANAVNAYFVGGGGYIVPEHLLAHDPNLRKSEFNTHPIGTGPYRLVRWDRGNALHFGANSKYFAGAPHIAKLEVPLVPQLTTRALLLRRGEIDVANFGVAEAATMKDVPSIELHRVPTYNIFYLDFNMRKSPMNELPVRRALAYATNRTPLIGGLLGLGTSADTMVSIQSRDYDAGNGCPRYDVRTANDLLTKAGWIRHGNGIRTRGSEKLHFELSFVSDPPDENNAVLLQQQWRAIGVDTTLRKYALFTLFGTDGVEARGAHEVAIMEIQSTDGTALSMFTSAQEPPKGSGGIWGYTNANVDRWMSATDTTGDGATRHALYAKVQQQICNDVPVIPLYWQQLIYGTNHALHGFEHNDLTSDLWNVSTWTLQ